MMQEALRAGAIDIIATDHAPHSPAEKAAPCTNFADIPGGMPGVTEPFESKLSGQLRAMAAEAAVRGISAERFAERCLSVYRLAVEGGRG